MYGGSQQTNTDEVTVTTSGTVGPFAVTSQNATGTAWNVPAILKPLLGM